MTFGEKLKICRTALSLTQERTAQMLEVSIRTVQAWEKDLYLPKTNKLMVIERVLRVPFGYLLDDRLVFSIENGILRVRKGD